MHILINVHQDQTRIDDVMVRALLVEVRRALTFDISGYFRLIEVAYGSFNCLFK